MLYTFAAVLMLLWLVGVLTATTVGGFIHVLLLFALVAATLRVISGPQAT